MLSGISIGTSMFLLTIIVCITMPKNGQVEGSPMALATANAKELAGMKKQIPINIFWGSHTLPH